MHGYERCIANFLLLAMALFFIYGLYKFIKIEKQFMEDEK